MTKIRYKPKMAGIVTPPDDIDPAIDALTDKGRAWLLKSTQGREILPQDIAKAADYERGDL